MTEILRVFNEIYSCKIDYCVVCMRTSRETRLESIRNLECFIKSVNLPYCYNEDFQKLCFMCSRAAAAAHQFRLAVNVSNSVHNLYQSMAHAPLRRADVAHQLTGLKTPTGVLRQAPVWEARLARLRARTVLLQTEVLVVDSLHNNQSDSTQAEAPDDLRVAPDERPRDTIDVLSEPEIYMESVVIIDEEDDPIEIEHELEEPAAKLARRDPPGRTSILQHALSTPAPAPDPALVPPQRPSVQSNPPEATNFLLHPIVESGGVVSVPSLAARVVDGRLVSLADSGAVAAPRLALQDGLRFSLLADPARVADVLRALGRPDVGRLTVVSDDIAVDVLERNVLRSVGPPVGPSESPGEIRIGSVTSMAGEPPPRNGTVAPRVTPARNVHCDEPSDTRRVGIDEGARPRGKGTESARATRRSETDDARITQGEAPARKVTDWEDKIPMDVISFMDATDPNAPTVAAPAHHVTTHDVIDLC